ncbi:MAG: chemotaxis protein CheW [Rhodospirillales bacterium CG15_BIG_FIL_POST_REV_8_21_14_020_66_15]|nr:MAG: chemotaxis protein CheW [Rhodospirillales bacterium CG15_BIG_FIL_POST_REV_8_21_14_020_66_15]
MAEVLAANSSRALREAETRELATHPGEDLEDFVTFRVRKQLFGIPVLMVQDILSPDRIASIPLAPPEVRGSINLRGRIVTVIDVRVRLGLPPSKEASENAMAVTVEHEHELYTLLVDSIGDVISLSNELYERNPATLDSLWREFSVGVYRLKGELMVVLDVHRLLNISVRI